MPANPEAVVVVGVGPATFAAEPPQPAVSRAAVARTAVSGTERRTSGLVARADALDDHLRDPGVGRKSETHAHDLGAVLGLDHLLGRKPGPLGHRRVDEARAERDRADAVGVELRVL